MNAPQTPWQKVAELSDRVAHLESIHEEILKFGSTTKDLRQAIEENEKEREWVLRQHEQLQKENAELKADSERLDWLEVNVRTNNDKIAKWNLDTFKADSLREVIDRFRHPTPESK